LGLSRAEVGVALPLKVVSGASVRPPSSVGDWPVVRPLFLFPCPSGFARSGLGVLVLVFSLFSVLFCVPGLLFRLGSLAFHDYFHLMLIFISSTLLRQALCV